MKKKKKIGRVKEGIIAIVVLIILGIIALVFAINQATKTSTNKSKLNNTISNNEEIISKNVQDVEYSREITDRYLEITGLGIVYEKSNKILNTSDIMNYLENTVCNTIPNTFEETKTVDLGNYYDKNHEKIHEKFGIEDKNQFITLINSLKEKNIDLSTWINLSVIKDSFELNSSKVDYAYFEFEVGYENGNKIVYGLYVKKDTSATIDKILEVK